jgi:hypothetical protein
MLLWMWIFGWDMTVNSAFSIRSPIVHTSTSTSTSRTAYGPIKFTSKQQFLLSSSNRNDDNGQQQQSSPSRVWFLLLDSVTVVSSADVAEIRPVEVS